jgi:hypothetical protein
MDRQDKAWTTHASASRLIVILKPAKLLVEFNNAQVETNSRLQSTNQTLGPGKSPEVIQPNCVGSHLKIAIGDGNWRNRPPPRPRFTAMSSRAVAQPNLHNLERGKWLDF